MKNIKLCFHHPQYIYKFKIDITILDNINMLSIQPKKIINNFNNILSILILTQQQNNVLETLSIGFKKQFISKYQDIVKIRRNVDYVGEHVDQQIQYFRGVLRNVSDYVGKCKQLYIFITRQTAQLQHFKHSFSTNYTYKLLYQFVVGYQTSQQVSKQNIFTFYTCISTILLNLYSSNHHKHPTSSSQPDKQHTQTIDYINKILLIGYDKLLNYYDYTHLTSYIQQIKQLWQHILNTTIMKQNNWLYKKYQNQLITTSVLRTIIQTIKPQNKNYKIQSDMISIINKILHKCQGINQLLLFITQCINLRITLRLQQFNQCMYLNKFNMINSIYLILPKDLTQDMGKKIIRLKQKYITQNIYKNQIKNGKQKLGQLIIKFTKFKNGKIQNKKQKQKQTLQLHPRKQKQRDRIRRQSFIMTNFQQIKHKYQQALLHQQENSKQYKLVHQNKQLLEMGKYYQQKIKEKQKCIQELEAAVAEFVDVKKKYVRQNVLKICSKICQFNTEFKFKNNLMLNEQKYNKQNKNYKKQEENSIQLKEQSPEKINAQFSLQLPSPPSLQFISNISNTGSSNIPSLPPPPPPPPNRQSKSLRASRNSKQLHILPPPPSLSLLNQLSPPPLPPPPPILPFSLSPPNTSKIRKQNSDRKDVKMINWTAVEISKVKDSFWESVNDVQFDQKQLISFFAKKQDKDKIIEAPKIILAPLKQKKSLLRPDRAKNIQIILKKTRIQIVKIPFAIQQLDDDTLTPQNIDSLLNIAPTPEQIQIFIQLRIIDPEQWSNADLYFCLISKIPGYVEILKALRFKYQFQYLQQQTNQKLNQFQTFFRQLQNDQFLKSFLSHLLTLGNFMNSDTSRGNAYGIKLQSIQKSYMVLGQDKKTSLFEYILQVMIKKGIKFNDKSFYRAQKITPIQILKQDLKQLTKQCRNVQQCLLLSGQEDLRTPQVFLSFYIGCRQKITVMDIKFNECLKLFNKVSDFYCQKVQSEKIMKIINDFRVKILHYIQVKKIDTKK